MESGPENRKGLPMDTITVTLPRVTNILIKKTGRVLELDNSRAGPGSIEFMYEYGATQKANDSHSAITRRGDNPFQGTDDEFNRAVDDEVDAIESAFYAGTLGVRAKVDPVAVMRKQLSRTLGVPITDELLAVMVAAGQKAAKAA